jgi:RNA polymerase sigma factor (sigma-70 family)
VLTVDDDPIVRQAVSAALRNAGYNVTEAGAGEEGVMLAAELRPDIIVMDIMMPPGITGIEATRRIVGADPTARVVMFSVHDSGETVESAIAAGARSYVAKRASVAVLLDAMSQTLAGRSVLIPAPATLGSRARHRPPEAPGRDQETGPGLESLTSQELAIAKAAATGLTNRQIASRTYLSSHTVNYHLRQIYKKLGINSRVQLARSANADRALTRVQELTASPDAAGPARGPHAAGHRPAVADTTADDVGLPTPVPVSAGADADTWAETVRRYDGLLTAIASQFHLSPCDAQDVAQSVWLRLVEYTGQGHKPVDLRKFLVDLTRRECLRLVRLNQRSVAVEPMIMMELAGPSDDSVEASLLAQERRKMLEDGLAEMSDVARDLLLLVVADPSPSYTDISQLLGLPIGSIGPTRQRALAKLRATHAVQAYLREGPPLP